MKLANVTTLLSKVATVAALAGAAAIGAPAVANAQVSFGVRVGHAAVYVAPARVYAPPAPVYVRPYPVDRGYYYAPAYPVRRFREDRFDRFHHEYWR